MAYIEKHIQDKLRTATHEELLAGESQFMSDMAEVLTPDVIAEGVFVDFGSNKTRFEETVKLLGLDHLIANNGLDVIGASVNGATTFHISPSRVRRVIEEDFVTLNDAEPFGILRALDYMQAESWEVENPDSYPYLSNRRATYARSQITLGKTYVKHEDETPYIDLEHPMIKLSMYVGYAPTEYDEYDNADGSLPYKMARFVADRDDTRVFEKLANNHAIEGMHLSLPEQAYSISLSSVAERPWDSFMGEVTPRTIHSYAVENDRIIKYVPPEDDY